MSELKDCPFCGGKASIFQDDTTHLSGSAIESWSVLCEGCDIMLSCYTERECVIQWNTRVTQSDWISVEDALPEFDEEVLMSKIKVTKEQLKCIEDLVVAYMVAVENKLDFSDLTVKSMVSNIDKLWDVNFEIIEEDN